MWRYNDYENTIRRWLNDYQELKGLMKDIEAELKDIEIFLASNPFNNLKSTTYDGMPKGEYEELNTTESTVEKIKIQRARLEELKGQYQRIKRHVANIDKALGQMGTEKKDLLINRFFNRQKWPQIAGKDLSEQKKLKRLANSAIREMAVYFFGQRAEKNNRFVFFD